MTLTPCYCINLRSAASVVSDIYDSHLKAFGLTVRQYSLLTCLGQIGEASTTYLAEYVSLDRTSVVRLIKPLLERGLIEDLAESGKRDRRLHLSEKGKELLEQAKPEYKKAHHEIEDKLGKHNLELIMNMLEVL